MEEDEALRLVSYVTSHSSSDNAVPRRLVHHVELGLYDLSDVVEDSFLLECVLATVNCMLLHPLGHVCEFDNRKFCFISEQLQ